MRTLSYSVLAVALLGVVGQAGQVKDVTKGAVHSIPKTRISQADLLKKAETTERVRPIASEW
jgi:hypothetical protein